MSAPDFTSKVHEMEKTIILALDGAQSGWNDKQSIHFKIYYVDQVLQMIKDLELGIQSHVDKIHLALAKLKAMEWADKQ